MYVPMMMYRLDEYFLKRRAEAPLLEMLPSEYIRRHFWFGTQPIEVPKDLRAMEAIFDMADGRDRFLFASDYPHWDYDDPITIDRLSFLSREDKAKVFAHNALGVFRFEKGGKQPWQNALSDAWTTSAQPVPSS
jgi:predicted TIM-barrel fold metal-dependent hydrolase